MWGLAEWPPTGYEPNVGLDHDADSTVFDQVDNCEAKPSRSDSEKVLRGSRRQPPVSSRRCLDLSGEGSWRRQQDNVPETSGFPNHLNPINWWI